MKKQFSLIRPKRLSEMVGQEKLAHQIRKLARKTIPKAWGFFGDTGFGKTTIARIIALSMQCKHQKKFGEPCSRCWRHYSDYPIFELDAGLKTGADDLRDFISGAEYTNIIGRGTRKVYILDEAHGLSKAAQLVLLKHLEDDSNETVWIIGSSESQKLIKPIRRRLISYKLKGLNIDAITAYAGQLAGSDTEVEDIVDVITQKQVDSPGIIAQVITKWLSGTPPEECFDDQEVDGLELGIAVTKGDWPAVCSYLQKAPNSAARPLRASIVGLLRKQLLETIEFNRRNKILSDCIKRLSYLQFQDDLVVMAALAGELYNVCELFSEYKR